MNQKIFYQTLTNTINAAKLYESPILKEKVLKCIPVKLNDQAKSAFKIYNATLLPNLKKDEKHILLDLKDFLCYALLQWFKSEFFEWFTPWNCESCKSKFQPSRPSCTPHNLKNMDMMRKQLYRETNESRVETYACPNATSTPFISYGDQIKCTNSTQKEFIRINNPDILLESRTGRCGEWANCFTLLLRALGFEARYCLDWTDHVWCEYFSTSQARWIHVDPCEAIIDKPLIYRIGWNKSNLSYVIAFNYRSVTDVSWRYSHDHAALLKRRNLVSERWLYQTLNDLNAQLKPSNNNNNPAHLAYSLEMQVKELTEFLSPPKSINLSGYQGRTSGDIDWRLSRLEIKPCNKSSSDLNSKKTEIEKHIDLGTPMPLNDIFAQAFKLLFIDSPVNSKIYPTNDPRWKPRAILQPDRETKILQLDYQCSDNIIDIDGEVVYSNDIKGEQSKLANSQSTVVGLVRKMETDWGKCYVCTDPEYFNKLLSKDHNQTDMENPKIIWAIKSLNVEYLDLDEAVKLANIKNISVTIRGLHCFDQFVELSCRLELRHLNPNDFERLSKPLVLSEQIIRNNKGQNHNSFDSTMLQYENFQAIQNVSDYDTLLVIVEFLFLPLNYENSQNFVNCTIGGKPKQIDPLLWQKAQLFRSDWTRPLSKWDRFLQSRGINYTVPTNTNQNIVRRLPDLAIYAIYE